MGANVSLSQKLQPIPKTHWKLVSDLSPSESCREYGSTKIYRNEITNDEVEQYNLLFETEQQYEIYLSSFSERMQEEQIVNTRYIDLQTNLSLCSCGKYVRVYIERIPLRFYQVNVNSEVEYIYILSACLKGYQRLFRKYGFFKMSKEMIGIDREGRIKVWMHYDFSKSNPIVTRQFQIRSLEDKQTLECEDKMVRNVIKQLKNNYPFQVIQILDRQIGYLTFRVASKLVMLYCQQHNISPCHYLQSILSIIQERKPSSYSQKEQQGSSYSIDGDVFRPIKTKDRIIYYVNPLERSEGIVSGISEISQPCKEYQSPKINYEEITRGVSIETPNYNSSSHPNFSQQELYSQFNVPVHSENDCSPNFQKNKPKVQFNYKMYAPSASQVSLSQLNDNASMNLQNKGNSRELCSIPMIENHKSRVQPVIYDNHNGQYKLDKDLTFDMMQMLQSGQ